MSAETSSSDDDGDDKAVGTLTVYISSDDGIPVSYTHLGFDERL